MTANRNLTNRKIIAVLTRSKDRREKEQNYIYETFRTNDSGALLKHETKGFVRPLAETE